MVHSLYLNVRNMRFTTHNVASTNLNLNQKLGKSGGMLLIVITSQIINLKMISDVLGLRKCYQCGGETLVPVVKHSVGDSTYSIYGLGVTSEYI